MLVVLRYCAQGRERSSQAQLSRPPSTQRTARLAQRDGYARTSEAIDGIVWPVVTDERRHVTLPGEDDERSLERVGHLHAQASRQPCQRLISTTN